MHSNSFWILKPTVYILEIHKTFLDSLKTFKLCLSVFQSLLEPQDSPMSTKSPRTLWTSPGRNQPMMAARNQQLTSSKRNPREATGSLVKRCPAMRPIAPFLTWRRKMRCSSGWLQWMRPVKGNQADPPAWSLWRNNQVSGCKGWVNYTFVEILLKSVWTFPQVMWRSYW